MSKFSVNGSGPGIRAHLLSERLPPMAGGGEFMQVACGMLIHVDPIVIITSLQGLPSKTPKTKQERYVWNQVLFDGNCCFLETSSTHLPAMGLCDTAVSTLRMKSCSRKLIQASRTSGASSTPCRF